MDSTVETGVVVPLPAEEARHITKVLRGRDGDFLEIVDGERRLFTAILRDGGRAIEISERTPAPPDRGSVTLYQAVPKGRHMDLVVEKATELGVGAIVPLVTEHGVVRLDDAGGKVERWGRVAQAAARQSLRLFVPPVSEPVGFREAAEEAGASGVLLHNVGDMNELERAVSGASVAVFVGPEGGWSEAEIETATRRGLTLARMGAFRLRSETAGIVAVARAMAALQAEGTNAASIRGERL